ncbi:MAG: CDP-alcohol phosphatidyltransferase family protein [Prevotella sp.]
MNYRDVLQKLIYIIINPIIKGMIKIGITPNAVTTIGLLLNIVAAAMLVYASALFAPESTTIVGWAGAVILFAGLFDMMDGRLARMGNMSSTFGAFYDSVLDRYSELFTLSGIAVFMMSNLWIWSSIATFAAIIGSIMVSYARARAEGLGIECKVGFMQRPERVVVTSLGAIVCGLTSELCALTVAMVLIAVCANITAFWRVAHCHKVLTKKQEAN